MPDVSCTFPPETKSQAKGRNGYFTPAQCVGYDFASHEAINGWRYNIELRSKRIGNHYPIVLNLTSADLTQFRNMLTQLIELSDPPEVLAKYRAAAKDEWDKDGEIEIDDNAAVSLGDDNGAYVAAWVWVHDPDDNEDDVPEAD